MNCSASCTLLLCFFGPIATVFENIYEIFLDIPKPQAAITAASDLRDSEYDVNTTNGTDHLHYTTEVTKSSKKMSSFTENVGISASSSMIATQAVSEAKLTQVPDQIGRPHPHPRQSIKSEEIPAWLGEQSNLQNLYSRPPLLDHPNEPFQNFQPYGIMSNFPNESETQEVNLGGINTDFSVQQHQRMGPFSGTRNEKGTCYGNQHSNSIWRKEDPFHNILPSKTYFNDSDSHFALHHNISQKSYGSKILDEFTYSGPVSDHHFQPYAPAKELTSSSTYGEGRLQVHSDLMNKRNRIDLKKGELDSASLHEKHRAHVASNMAGRRGIINSNFLNNEGMPFLNYDSRDDNIRRGRSGFQQDSDIYQSELDSSPKAISIHTRPVGGVAGFFYCILCYTDYRTSEKLTSHCSNDPNHLALVQLDCGADKIWLYPPPPPHKSLKINMCTKW